MKRLILILLCTMVIGCAPGDKLMRTPQPSHEDLPMDVRVRIIDFTSSLDAQRGNARYWKKSCEIAIPKPEHIEDSDAFCAIGHELWHCLTGDFHHDIKAYCSD